MTFQKMENNKKKRNKLQNEIENSIITWNKKYPIDCWWRRKYNVPFGSERHRQANFIQMFFDYQEQKMVEKSLEEYRKRKSTEGAGVTKDLSQEQIDYDFDNLDLSQYNSKQETDG